ALHQAQNALLNAQDKYWALAHDALDENGNVRSDLPEGLKMKYRSLEDLVNQYNTALRALQDAEGDSHKAQLALDDARQAEVQEVAEAEAKLADARGKLQHLLDGPTRSDMAEAQASVAQAQATLVEAKAPPTDAEIATDEANVVKAQTALDKARLNLGKASLLAPFDGVVSKVSAREGSSLTAGSEAFSMYDPT